MRDLPRWQFFSRVSSETRFVQYNGATRVIFAFDYRSWMLGFDFAIGVSLHVGPFYLYVRR